MMTLPTKITTGQAAVLQATLDLERRGLGYMPAGGRWASARSLRRAGLLLATEGRHEESGEEGVMFLLTRLGRFEAFYPRGEWCPIGPVAEGARVQLDARGWPVLLQVPADVSRARLLRYVESAIGFRNVRPFSQGDDRVAVARTVAIVTEGDRNQPFLGVEPPPAIAALIYRSALYDLRSRLDFAHRAPAEKQADWLSLTEQLREQIAAALEFRMPVFSRKGDAGRAR
jgi:hypothetical protein